MLLAADARGSSDQALHEQAELLLKAGARYACFWGPDCERVHDAFDQAALTLGLDHEGAVVITTWHSKDPLKEATWFAANAAYPDEPYADASGALVAIAVGSRDWELEIRDYLQAGAPIEDEAS